MAVRLVDLAAIDQDLRKAWREIVDSHPRLNNPFLHPAFCEAADGRVGSVKVVVAEEDHRPIAFLPFQLARGSVATPVAEGLNEQQAIVACTSNWDGSELVRATGASSFRFDHLVGEQAESVGAWVSRSGGSPQADLRNGYEPYVASRREAGSSTIRETMRKRRKLIREIGPLRFQWHVSDDASFDKLLEWKRRQHERTGVIDLFSSPGVIPLLRAVRDTEEPGFCGRYSVLYAGDEPIAVHLGLFGRQTGHLWYPSYDPAYSNYSPGLILILEIIQKMVELGFSTLDFGPGPQRYKRSLQTNARAVCIGVVDQNPAVSIVRRSVHYAKYFVKKCVKPSPRTPQRLA
jgi:CelD/BcsL family acetyltransferase involved in cellulose biosynthesis